MEAKALGFDGICLNSIDGVSDRDFAAELCAALSIEMMHLSRLSEELILWSSWEFQFIELPDAYTTGSSIMPQKSLPLAYNKDMQEDKEGVFDACDTAKLCLEVMAGMLPGMKARREKMLKAASEGFINATDLADYLVTKGLPFRSAYKLSGSAVAQCIREGKTLETVSLAEYQKISPLIEADIYEHIDLGTCVAKRVSAGGTSVRSVEKQIAAVREFLSE